MRDTHAEGATNLSQSLNGKLYASSMCTYRANNHKIAFKRKTALLMRFATVCAATFLRTLPINGKREGEGEGVDCDIVRHEISMHRT